MLYVSEGLQVLNSPWAAAEQSWTFHQTRAVTGDGYGHVCHKVFREDGRGGKASNSRLL